MADRLVFVKVNGYEDTLLTQQHGVVGYPTLILMTPDGTEIDRYPGFAAPADFIQIFEDYLAGRGTLVDLETRFQSYPDSLELLFSIAEKYQYRGADAVAESCFAQLIAADPKDQSGKAAQALHSMARIAYYAGAERYDTAIARFEAVSTQFGGSDLAEDALTWVPYIMAKQERYQEALDLYEQFLEDYPESREVAWVQKQIANIRAKGI